jgi:hypothetical protein
VKVAERADFPIFLQNMWTPPGLTLARESRHIVALELSDTTSRAAVLILDGPVLGVNARAVFPPGEG